PASRAQPRWHRDRADDPRPERGRRASAEPRVRERHERRAGDPAAGAHRRRAPPPLRSGDGRREARGHDPHRGCVRRDGGPARAGVARRRDPGRAFRRGAAARSRRGRRPRRRRRGATVTWVTDPLSHVFFRHGLLAGILGGALCGLVGVYVVLKRMSYIGHGLSHAIFGGAAVAYVLNWNFYLGAGAWGVLSALLINGVARRRKIGADAAIGVVTTASFAI